MAGSVKGITIEFNGETTKLDKALRNINKETKDIDSELKKVKTALKFNPTSVELWRQKQQLLAEKVGETKKKLDLLKKAQAKLDADGVAKNTEEYRKLQREIIETESKCKSFEGELRGIGNVNLRAAAAQVEEVGNKLTAAGEALAPVSAAAATIVASIGALTAKSASWADDLNTMSKIYGISTEQLQLYAATADLVDVEVETIAAAHRKLTKSMATAKDGSGAAAEAFEKLGVKVTDSNGELRQTEDVFNDVVKALGGIENDTERDAAAMDLLGKSAQELNPLIEDAGETYKNLSETFDKYGLEFVDQESLDRANEMQDQLDTIKAVGTVAMQTIGVKLAGYIAPALEKVADLVGKIAEWLSTLSPETLAMVTTIAAVVAVAAPLLLILGQLAFAISSIMTLVGVLAPILAGVSLPILGIIAAIVAVIAIGVLLYKNWDKIKAKAQADWQSVVDTVMSIKDKIVNTFTQLKQKVADTWNSLKNNAITAWETLKSRAVTTFQKIKDAILKPITSAKEKFQSIVNTIKGLFPLNVGKIFDGFKLPHFSLDGGQAPYGFGGKGRMPSLNIDWYAKGGIFSNPTVIGIGEAGPEAVIPLDKLWGYLDAIARNGGGGTTINVYGGNATAREIALEVERVIINDTKRRRLAWQ